MNTPAPETLAFIAQAAAQDHRWVLVSRNEGTLAFSSAPEHQNVEKFVASVPEDNRVSLYDLHAPLGEQLGVETYWATTKEDIAPYLFKLPATEAYDEAIKLLEQAGCKNPHQFLRDRAFALIEASKDFETVREAESYDVDLGEGRLLDLECLLLEKRIEDEMDGILSSRPSIEMLQALLATLCSFDDEAEKTFSNAEVQVYPVSQDPPQWTLLLFVHAAYRTAETNYEKSGPDTAKLADILRKQVYTSLDQFSAEAKQDIVIGAVTVPTILPVETFRYTKEEVADVKEQVFKQQERDMEEERAKPGTKNIEKHYSNEEFDELAAKLPMTEEPTAV